LVSDRSWARASPVFFIRGDFFWYSFVWQTKEYKSSTDEIGIDLMGLRPKPYFILFPAKKNEARKGQTKRLPSLSASRLEFLINGRKLVYKKF
jgi:hypothetical protein